MVLTQTQSLWRDLHPDDEDGDYQDPTKGAEPVQACHGITRDDDLETTNCVPCETWIQDPEYYQNPILLWSDFALCQLESPILIDESNSKLVLNRDLFVPAPQETLIVLGFGATEDGVVCEDDFFQGIPGEDSDVLLEVNVPSVSTQECRGIWPEVDHQHVCAGYTEALPDLYEDCFYPDANAGDSGGPLLLPKTKVDDGTTVYIHVGIVSYGAIPGGRIGAPGVYARTSSGFPWIYETVCDGSNGLDPNSTFCGKYSELECTNGPELTIAIHTDSQPKQNGWKLSVQDNGDNTWEEVTSVYKHFKRDYNYETKLCLEDGKQYQWELYDSTKFSRCYYLNKCPKNTYRAADGYGCDERGGIRCLYVENCDPANDESACDCGLELDSCGTICSDSENCGTYSLLLDGVRIPNTVSFEFVESDWQYGSIYRLTETFLATPSLASTRAPSPTTPIPVPPSNSHSKKGKKNKSSEKGSKQDKKSKSKAIKSSKSGKKKSDKKSFKEEKYSKQSWIKSSKKYIKEEKYS